MRLDLLDLQALVPGEEQRHLRPAVVLDVALAADERAHLLARCRRRWDRTGARGRDLRQRSMLWMCGVGSALLGERADAEQEPRARHAQLHRLRIVAVDAAHGVGALGVRELELVPPATGFDEPVFDHLGVRRRVRHRAERREALEDVAAAQPAVGRDHRRVAVQAIARLRHARHALGLLLIGQHVRVAAPIAIVDRERVAREQPLQPRIAVDLLVGQRLGTAVLRAADVRRAAVSVVLARPVHSPRRRVGRLLVDLDQAQVGILRLLLALEDVHEQRHREKRDDGGQPAASRRRPRRRGRFVVCADSLIGRWSPAASAARAVADAAMAVDAAPGVPSHSGASLRGRPARRARSRRGSAGSCPAGSPRSAA